MQGLYPDVLSVAEVDSFHTAGRLNIQQAALFVVSIQCCSISVDANITLSRISS